MGASRKNAADIKMVVDAIEMAFERDYITTFVMCTGDSDFSPLVHKLRELNRRVIGVGVELSTSRLLPPACDEFLFYDRLAGVEAPDAAAPTDRRRRGPRSAAPAHEPPHGGAGAGSSTPTPVAPPPAGEAPSNTSAEDDEGGEDAEPLEVLVAQTLAGLQTSSSGAITASVLK